MRSFVLSVALLLLLVSSAVLATDLFDNAVPHVEADDDVTVRAAFAEWASKFGKVYGSAAETETRFRAFKANQAHIRYYQQMDRGAVYGNTQFADLTPEEFKSLYLSPFSMDKSTVPKNATYITHVPYQDIPTDFNWNDHGAVTPVKNQAQCGSCWSFSATGSMEGQYFLKYKTLKSFSEQMFVDCEHDCSDSPPWGHVCDQGCGGGLPWDAWKYAIANGTMDEASYPYTAVDGTCQFDATKVVAKPIGFKMLSTNEGDMQQWLYANGPISVCLNANPLQYYSHGIMDPIFCDKSALDHAVLIVGYGNGKNWIGKDMDFWVVKNSWSTGWGEKGFFRIKRGDDKCGIATVPATVQF